MRVIETTGTKSDPDRSPSRFKGKTYHQYSGYGDSTKAMSFEQALSQANRLRDMIDQQREKVEQCKNLSSN